MDAPPPGLAIQYADFAMSQKGEGGWNQANLDFWKGRFSSEIPSLDLPVYQRTGNLPAYKGRSVDFDLPREISKAFRTLVLAEDATLYMGLLAVFALLLSRLTGQTDMIIGTPVAGRSLPEINQLIGVFINMLPIHCDLSGKPTFRQLLGRIREESLLAFTHQDLPYEVLVRNLPSLANENKRGPVSVVFQLRNIPRIEVQVENLLIEEIQAANNSAQYDLVLDMSERDGTLHGKLTYKSDLFDAATILRWVKHFKTLISHIVSDPDAPAASLSLLDDNELYQVCQEWNATIADIPRKSVPALFEAQCKTSPGTTALSSAQKQLSYDEVNRRTNQLAHFLVRCGVEKGSIIAFCLERSIETVITMLGILKAGGIYLPLDPTYPKARLAYMLEEAGASILISHSDLAGILPQTNSHIIYLDRDEEQITREDESALDIRIGADDPAYLMYTSGSTGHPKGVLVPHKAIIHLVLNTNYIHINPNDTLAQVSNISFDAATFEIWGALLNGAKLVIVPRDILLTPGSFALELQERKINILFLTTALFNQLARQIPDALNSLRCLLFGGEQADTNAVRNLLRSGHPQHLIHVYGPTENTTFSTWHPVEKVGENDLSIPIGHPVANTYAYILDENLNPLPPGIAGELHLAGDGLALGYWKDEELTRAKFIANPFNPHPDSWLFRTGDICRYLPDGNIVFMGRKDQQIKMRGHRIELGEITAALNEIASVRDNVTIQQRSSGGEVRLASYVVINMHETVSMQELRDYLQKKLPAYMLPHTITRVVEIPLTPNGKIDYNALPQPSDLKTPSLNTYNPPQTATEKILAGIWAEHLELDRVGRDDNFFDLGGHSLLVVSLCAHIEEKLRISLSFAEVYSQPVLHRMASLVDKQLFPAVEMPQTGTKFFWCGNGFDLLQKQYQSPGWLYRLPLPAEDGKRPTQKSVPAFAADYIQIIKANQPHGPYYLGGFSFGGLVVYEIAQQLTRLGDEVSLLFLLEPAQNQHKGASPIKRSAIPEKIQNTLAANTEQGNVKKPAKGSILLERLRYPLHFMWQKVKNRLVDNNNSLVKLIRYQWYLAINGSVPIFLRNEYVIQTWNRLIHGYIQQPYEGHAVVLLSEGTGVGARLPIKHVRKIIIPGAQTHTDPVFGAYRSFWLDHLSTYLNEFKIL
jgi:amino acid adenylation domain-containing protein